MNIKLYARQVPDEECMTEFDFDAWPDVSFFGNTKYMGGSSRRSSALRQITEELYEVKHLMEKIKCGSKTIYQDYAEVFDDLIPSCVKENYSPEQVELIAQAISLWNSKKLETEDCYCVLLSAMTEREWKWKCIRGSTQDAWQNVYYPADEYSEEEIDKLASEYFCEGTEWEVYEGLDNAEIVKANDLDDFEMESCCYCSSDDADVVKQELGNLYGYRPEEVALFYYVCKSIEVVKIYKEVV